MKTEVEVAPAAGVHSAATCISLSHWSLVRQPWGITPFERLRTAVGIIRYLAHTATQPLWRS
ncbi:MAG TPA: hypothetical protein P5205_12540 [Candidatus Paceibacterota bacterium]|nr:hypothetical protein [Verrucomicrobiota bacterium]HSA11189.1 hypothetical protein [Candidatus Paceibacterota bacterium]